VIVRATWLWKFHRAGDRTCAVVAEGRRFDLVPDLQGTAAMRFALCLTVLLASAPLAARADGDQPKEQLRWYGAPILASDLLSVGLVHLAFRGEDNGALLAAAGATWLLAPPIVHGLNGYVSRSGISVSMRVLLPLAFGAVGYQIGRLFDQCDFSCDFEYGVTGFLGGALAASVGDLLLATERVAAAPMARPAPRPGPTFAPVLQLAGRSFGAGLLLTY
jgi:hypothetical protein